MTRRESLALFAALVWAALPVMAHEGHEHKVLGTVSMAAADHVMLKDKNNKEVTVYLNRDTRILKGKKPMTVADIKPGMRVVVTAVTVKEKDVEKMIAKTIELGAAQPPIRRRRTRIGPERYPGVTTIRLPRSPSPT